MEQHIIIYKDVKGKKHSEYFSGDTISRRTKELEDEGFIILSTNLIQTK